MIVGDSGNLYIQRRQFTQGCGRVPEAQTTFVRQALGNGAFQIDNSWYALHHASYALQLSFAAIAQIYVATQP